MLSPEHILLFPFDLVLDSTDINCTLGIDEEVVPIEIPKAIVAPTPSTYLFFALHYNVIRAFANRRSFCVVAHFRADPALITRALLSLIVVSQLWCVADFSPPF